MPYRAHYSEIDVLFAVMLAAAVIGLLAGFVGLVSNAVTYYIVMGNVSLAIFTVGDALFVLVAIALNLRG